MLQPSSKNTGVFFSQYTTGTFKEGSFSKKKLKRKAMKKQVHDPGGPGSAVARKKNKRRCRVHKKRKRKRSKNGRPYVEGGKKDDRTTRLW